VGRKDSLIPFGSIRVWLGYNFGSEVGDKIALDLILFDPFWFDVRVRVQGGHTLRMVPQPERAPSGAARSQSEAQQRIRGQGAKAVQWPGTTRELEHGGLDSRLSGLCQVSARVQESG
jgi:hypothetical protein